MGILLKRKNKYHGLLSVESRSLIIFNAIWHEIKDDICNEANKKMEFYDKYVVALSLQIFNKSIVWGMKEQDFFEHLEIIAKSSFCENIACYGNFLSGFRDITLRIKKDEEVGKSEVYKNVKDYADTLAMFEITGYAVNTWHKNRYGMTLSEKC